MFALPEPRVMHSTQDASVNFVTKLSETEALEARFVRRTDEYIVVYLSSQTACAQACRFCHLTATGQIRGRDATVREIRHQAEQVLRYFREQVRAGEQAPAPVVHFNFMARGEPLKSEIILTQGSTVMEMLYDLGRAYHMTPIVKISTIGSDNFENLLDIFPYEQPDIYYSLYSFDEQFRRRWLPKAPPPMPFLEILQRWQTVTAKIPTLHHALIDGENDSPEQAVHIANAVNGAALRVNFNLVRYNPPTPHHGVEASEASRQTYLETLREAWPQAHVKQVTKVGYDVAASCGMFVGGRRLRIIE